MKEERSAPDPWLMIATFLLLSMGLIMVYSASAVLAFREYGDSFYYVKRQLLFAALGLLAMYGMMNVDYWVWKKVAHIGLLVCFILLVIVMVPGIGVVRGGARSWLGIGSFGVQPSEFMKMGLLIYLAHYLSLTLHQVTFFIRGLLWPLTFVGVAFLLIMLQPDMGTGAVLVGSSLLMIFAAGARVKHLCYLGLLGVLGFVMLIAVAPYRLQRIVAFLDPWQDPLGAGYQAIQSLYAIGSGGLGGLGLGQSRQKHSYLPEPQTDFIFSIIGEELGFIGCTCLIVLFMFLIYRGLKVAMTARDNFGSLVALGIIAMIAVQVVINIGVVIGLFPVTGITLPLISAGGSSLTLMLTSIGILLNISRYAR